MTKRRAALALFGIALGLALVIGPLFAIWQWRQGAIQTEQIINTLPAAPTVFLMGLILLLVGVREFFD